MSAPDSMAVYAREIRGVPPWFIQEYLQQLGGQIETDGWVRGAGWKACLTPMEDYQIGSLRVGQVRLELRGCTEAVGDLRNALEKRLLRAGG